MNLKTLLAFGFLLFGVDCAFCESAVPCKNDIAIVDLKKAAAESLAGKGIENQIESINNSSKKDLVDLESKIKSMESGKKNDFDSRKIEDMQVILYDMVRTKRYEISEAYKVAISTLEAEMKKIIQKIAIKNNVKVVIASDAVVYADAKCLDITTELVKEIDKACPHIVVELKEQK